MSIDILVHIRLFRVVRAMSIVHLFVSRSLGLLSFLQPCVFGFILNKMFLFTLLYIVSQHRGRQIDISIEGWSIMSGVDIELVGRSVHTVLGNIRNFLTGSARFLFCLPFSLLLLTLMYFHLGENIRFLAR